MRAMPVPLLLGVLLMWSSAGHAEHNSALRLVQTIPLPGVGGRLDHMAVGRRAEFSGLDYWFSRRKQTDAETPLPVSSLIQKEPYHLCRCIGPSLINVGSF